MKYNVSLLILLPSLLRCKECVCMDKGQEKKISGLLLDNECICIGKGQEEKFREL